MTRTLYKINEKDRFINITISLDQPSCETVTVIAVPQVQSPVDASGKIKILNVLF